MRSIVVVDGTEEENSAARRLIPESEIIAVQEATSDDPYAKKPDRREE
jgi:hypothetical protein